MRLDEINHSDETELLSTLLNKLLDKQKTVQVWFKSNTNLLRASEEIADIPPEEIIEIDSEFSWRYAGDLLESKYLGHTGRDLWIVYTQSQKKATSKVEPKLIENKKVFLKKHADHWRLFIDRW